jgi:predicted transcriptional regulator
MVMPRAKSLSIRLDPELDDRLGVVANSLDRPRAWVVQQAIREFVELQSWHLAAIDEGLRQADAGRLVPHEKVVDWVKSWGRSDELPMPECE